MSKIHDEAREDRIMLEVVVDCYDDEEVATGWYYYFAENLDFPFAAQANLKLRGGKMEQKKVKIVEVETDDITNSEKLRLGVMEEGSDRVQFISPQHLISIDTTTENSQIINDWLYWHDFNLI
jgi:Calcium binding